jgi:DNA-directed RNA polymerase subunit E'/Rpb7
MSDSATETAGGGFAELFEQSIKAMKEGDVVRGRVLSIDDDNIQIDIGFKSEGLVPAWEFMDDDGTIQISVGDEVDVLLENAEGEDDRIVLSKEKADRLKIWDEISRAYKADESVEGVVIARVKGGLAVDIGVKAFLPGSQVDLRPVRNLEQVVGQKLKFKVIKFNKRRANIVLSRRALLETERKKLRENTLETLAPGQIVDGVIKNLTGSRRHRRAAARDGHVVGACRPSRRALPGRGRDQSQGAQVRFGQRARLVGSEADPAGPVDRCVDALSDRQARRRARGVIGRIRCFHRTRAGHRGTDPRFRDVVDEAHQAPLEGRLCG